MIKVEDHIRLARKIANDYHKFLANKYTYDEIESEAFLGLIKAAKRFDEDRGFKFSTYATSIIRGEITRMVRDDKRYFLKRGVPHLIASLNILLGEGLNKTEMQDLLEDNEDIEESLVQSILVEKLLESLNLKEKEIINLYFYQNVSQTEISKIVNCSQPQVGRIIRKSLEKMKKNLSKEQYMLYA